MPNLFPIGALSTSTSTGTMSGSSYSMFEPNNGCASSKVYNILVSMYEQQTQSTRKKAFPYLSIVYSYAKIYTSEYRQIERFVDTIAEDALNSFWVVDLSKGITPTSVEIQDTTYWKISMNDTVLYDTTLGQKANYVFIWTGWTIKKFKLMVVTGITQDVSLVVGPIGSHYGDLTLSDITSMGFSKILVYPVYTCYCIPQALSSLKASETYFEEVINTSGDGGYMYDGSISFVSKFKV